MAASPQFDNYLTTGSIKLRYFHRLRPESGLKSQRGEICVSQAKKKNISRKGWLLAGLLVAALLMAAVWRWTPLQEHVTRENLAHWVETIRASPHTPFILMAVYLLATLVFLPINLLNLTTVLTFGPLWGFVYGLSGSVLSAVVAYWVGMKLGRETLEKISRRWLDKINRALARKGIITVITMCLMPVAPFSIINLVSGASRIKFSDFILGTLVGMGAGITVIAIFGSGLERLISKPDWGSFFVFLLAVTVSGGLFWLLYRVLGRAIEDDKEA
ncbi:TVP38/TMEM64 family protein [Geoalkalibacter halelectricus]|uniref:TVP38/TMEM64 family membrane protein n=1 Tax=Geoalkalibacter halelectricus TaxID=2847045 RepID=A0ABY5ZHN3_9BACT|nr:TVP38/TMEM64 family protein [Geoalkalibacter halelectricus]MDO3380223.1 TVP38/TMEM64 family protein [Geoalkalibacter halelectricus]UWZ78206.1 TVP38/TMEM64 family protein [Geoalkalibacter halelectricus]